MEKQKVQSLRLQAGKETKSNVSDSAAGKAKSTVPDAKVTKSAKPKEVVQ